MVSNAGDESRQAPSFRLHEQVSDTASFQGAVFRKAWTPRTGSLINHRALTATMIDSRDFLAAKRRSETEPLLPTGTRIAFTGDLIWRINDANNIDKHRLIMPAMRAVSAPMLKIKDGPLINNLNWLGEFPAEMEIEDYRDLAFDILFEKPTLLAAKPVTSTLVEACDAVQQAIEIFETEL